ncbi:MAG TPA: Ig-like domain-containing protein [Candidatus Saccharimonadales bacterium]|nr:Ig-like domain-containing protein [Candidatus Saccharimonadales bacterium]
MCASLSGCFSGPPQIIQLIPNRGAVGVAADAPVTVEFDRPVVTASVRGRFSVSRRIHSCDLEAAFDASALAPCRIVWLPGDTGFTLLHPKAIFAPSTSYTFTLAGGIRDPSGVVNSVDHHWTITTGAAPVIRALQPADGSHGVPVDAPISVSFSTAMAAGTTQAAISLNPAVPGTRVVRNLRDPSRFVVLPGATLQAGVAYSLRVASTATDVDHQPLPAAATSTFTTAGMSPVAHVVVLAGVPGEGATSVLVSPLAPAEAGEPISSEAVLVAPRCPHRTGCGAAAFGGPLYTYASAALSPGGAWLAVVEVDATVSGSNPVLLVLDPATGTVVKSFESSSLPSWSPDGSMLAFSRAGNVSFFNPTTEALTNLPPGHPMLAPAVWSPLGEQLVLDVAGTSDVQQLELADSVVLARYPVPGLTGGASNPAISPDGSQLAFSRSAPGVQGAWIAGIGASPAAPRLLDPFVQPVGFTATGTLLGIDRPAAGAATLVLVSVAGDEQIPIASGPALGALGTVVVAPSGRQLVFLNDDANGIVQAYVENADGSNVQVITDFTPQTLVAVSVAVSG